MRSDRLVAVLTAGALLILAGCAQSAKQAARSASCSGAGALAAFAAPLGSDREDVRPMLAAIGSGDGPLGGCQGAAIAGFAFGAVRAGAQGEEPLAMTLSGGEARVTTAAGEAIAIKLLANLPGFFEAYMEVGEAGAPGGGIAAQRVALLAIDRLAPGRLPRSGAIQVRPPVDATRLRLRFLPCAFSTDDSGRVAWDAAIYASLSDCGPLALGMLAVSPRDAEMAVDNRALIATLPLPAAPSADAAFAIDASVRFTRREP